MLRAGVDDDGWVFLRKHQWHEGLLNVDDPVHG